MAAPIPFCPCVSSRLRYHMSRYHRLRRTGPRNANYGDGTWTRWRQRLERQLADGVDFLSHFERVLRRLLAAGAPRKTFDQVGELLGWLRDHPAWAFAMQDPRRGYRGRWYIPRAAWALANRWGQVCGQLMRLVMIATSTIPGAISPSVGREVATQGSRSPQGGDAHRRAAARAAWERAFPGSVPPWRATPT